VKKFNLMIKKIIINLRKGTITSEQYFPSRVLLINSEGEDP
jgi:hypothetical protein